MNGETATAGAGAISVKWRIKGEGGNAEVSTLVDTLSEFNEDDVEALDEALRKFAAIKAAVPSALPNYSPGFVAYTPILSFALLKSQAAVERLTRRLTFLTCVLIVLAAAQTVAVVLVLT